MKIQNQQSFSGWRSAILVLLVLMVATTMPALAAGVHVIVADNGNNAIKEILPDGTTVDIATGGDIYQPCDVAVDSQGNVYVANHGAKKVVKISASDGTITELGSSFAFSAPRGIDVDSLGNVYVGDGGKHKVYKINAADDSVVLLGSVKYVYNVAVDTQGNVYAISSLYGVQKILTDGTIVTYATGFNKPSGVAVDTQGNVYVADSVNNEIKKVLPDGTILTLGSGFSFNLPIGVEVDSEGNVYVGDWGNNAIRKILPDGTVETLGSGFSYPWGVDVFEEEETAVPEFPVAAFPVLVVVALAGIVFASRRR